MSTSVRSTEYGKVPTYTVSDVSQPSPNILSNLGNDCFLTANHVDIIEMNLSCVLAPFELCSRSIARSSVVSLVSIGEEKGGDGEKDMGHIERKEKFKANISQ